MLVKEGTALPAHIFAIKIEDLQKSLRQVIMQSGVAWHLMAQRTATHAVKNVPLRPISMANRKS